MHIGARILLVSLLGVTTIATAQETSVLAKSDATGFISPEQFGETCVHLRASRPTESSDCQEITVPRIDFQRELKPTLVPATPAEIALQDCRATVTLEYKQNDKFAGVEGVIENESCAAAGGKFVVAIKTRDASSEIETREFSQAWARRDDQPIKFSGRYAIADNVDLIGVRAIKMQCKCENTKK